MKTSLFIALSILVSLTLVLSASGIRVVAQGQVAGQTLVSTTSRSRSAMYIENVGQFADGARFQVRGGDRTIWLADDAIWVTVLEKPTKEMRVQGDEETWPLSIRSPLKREAPSSEIQNQKGANFKLSFVGANPHPHLEPFNRLDTHVSYFIGSDPDKWHPDVPVWGGVRYVDLYPGIDLEITGKSGQTTQRIIAHSNANPSAVRLQVEGADALALNGDYLRLTTAIGEFSLPLLQWTDVTLAPPTIIGDQIVSPFAIPTSTPQPATYNLNDLASNISSLLYCTFLGAGDRDWSHSAAIDASGAAYITGETYSSDFPTTPGAFDTTYNGGPGDAFVVKLDARGGALAYATFLGGRAWDVGWDIAVDSSGAAYVTGSTYYYNDWFSSDFPTTPGAFAPSFNGYVDAFVVKLNPTGSTLAYSTFLGGNNREEGYSISIDASGAAHITGVTCSSDFPTTLGAFDTTYNNGGDRDAFVVKLNATGSALEYATFLGASSEDYSIAIAIDANGAAYVTGYTFSYDFPTTLGAFDTTFNGGADCDAFVVKLNAVGSALAYATFLGGSSNDWSYDIAAGESGMAYTTGATASPDFPTTPGAFDTTYNDLGDAFVVKLNAIGSTLDYATFLGGGNLDSGEGLAVNTGGAVYVTGYTNSSDFPTTPEAFDTSYNNGGDAFAIKLNTAGSALAYATFLGGSGYDLAERSVARDTSGAAYVTGYTDSSDFPTTLGAFDRTHNGGLDAFVVKLAMGGEGVFSISGLVTAEGGNPLPGVKVSAGSGGHATSGASGYFTLTGLITDTYTITPTKSGYTFYPLTRTVSVPPDATGQDFLSTPLAIYSISGQTRYFGGGPLSGATVSANGVYTTISDASGNYTLAHLIAGTYVLTATKSGYTLSPPSYTFEMPPSTTGLDFVTMPAWTLMFYLGGDNNLETGYALPVFNQLEVVAGNPDVQIVALLDRQGENNSAYYEIQYDADLARLAAYTETVNYWSRGEVDMADPQALVDFVNWARVRYWSQHYALILSDHGQGLGGAMVDDTGHRNWLTVPEIEGALVSATLTGTDKIDVLYMDACLMGMIEDAYQVRDYVDYYVASENIKNGFPNPYIPAISGITITTTPAQLATRLTTTYGDVCNALRAPCTMSTADMSRLPDVVTATNMLAYRLNSQIATVASTLTAIRHDVQRFDENNDSQITPSDDYIDLYDFACLVKSRFSGSGIQESAQAVMDAISAYIVAEHHRSGAREAFLNLDNSHGVSIFFPSTASSFYSAKNYRFAVGATWPGATSSPGDETRSAVEWGPMLVSYFQLTQPGGPDNPTPPEPVPQWKWHWVYLPVVIRQ